MEEQEGVKGAVNNASALLQKIQQNMLYRAQDFVALHLEAQQHALLHSRAVSGI